jgi:hypothetical protein
MKPHFLYLLHTTAVLSDQPRYKGHQPTAIISSSTDVERAARHYLLAHGMGHQLQTHARN